MKKIYFLTMSMLTLAFTATSQIGDPSFETGPGGTAWTQASTNFGTPLCDLASCGSCGGPCVSNTGDWYAWYGGAGGAVETGSVEQSAIVPTGATATINMMVKIANAGPGLAADRLEVSMDGAIIGTITSGDSVAYTNYAMYSIPINAAANGAAHTFKIEGFQSSTAVFNLLVDDVTISVDGTVVNLFEFEMGENEVILYPNPVKENLTLQFRNVTGDVDVVITDLSGKVVSNEQVSAAFGKSFNLNTENMNNGSYFITVKQDGVVLRNEKIVINK
jgi:Secretion system C-terminal sorting domain